MCECRQWQWVRVWGEGSLGWSYGEGILYGIQVIWNGQPGGMSAARPDQGGQSGSGGSGVSKMCAALLHCRNKNKTHAPRTCADC